jgi:DNA-binding NtrC family response regulator
VLRLGDAVGVVTRRRDDLGPPRVDEPIPGVLFGPALNALLGQIRKLAAGDLPIVIEGPTGAGKEGVARTLHELSERAGGLQAVNCGALPPGLAEAELFGHRKGAFTGAEKDTLGHDRAAHGGTLFLDELYDLAPSVQAKLLRVLQEKQVQPLGETRPVPVDVRVVAASLVPLQELVETGRLREDLAARLAGVSLVVPPLADRREDISPLFLHFLSRHSGGRPPALDSKLLEHLILRPWRGNVRELELLTRRLLALHGHEPLLRRNMVEDALPSASPGPSSSPSARRRSGDDDAEDLQKLAAAFATHGNLSRAAQEAGISRQRAYRLLDGKSPHSLLQVALGSNTGSGNET